MGFATRVSPNVNHGGFATREEIEERFPKVNYMEGKIEVSGVNIISDGTQAVIASGEESTGVVGSTGSKKTRDIVLPYALSCAYAGNSMIIHDCKGEINKHLYKLLKKLGYKIIVLDYRNPERGERYNPLEYAAKLYKSGKVDRAREIMKSFADTIFETVRADDDPLWHLTAAQYLAGLTELACQCLPPEEVTIDNVYNLHLQGNEKFGMNCYMEAYFADDITARCWKRIYPVVTAPNETKRSYFSVFSSCMDVFVQSDAIVDQTSHSTFQIQDIIEEKTAVFLISRDEGAVYNGLISAVLDQFYNLLVDAAEENNGRLNRCVDFILDEFGNLTKINNMEKKISLSRARNIRWLIVCQSFEQLNLVYGEKVAKVIIENCPNIVYMHSPDGKMLEYISSLCGKTTDEYTGEKHELLSVEQLRCFSKEKGECLMLLGRTHPFITYLPDISEYYGIEVTERVNVTTRKHQELTPVNFKKVVEDKRVRKMDMMLERDKEERMSRIRRETERRQKIRMEDPKNVLSIVNDSIVKMQIEE